MGLPPFLHPYKFTDYLRLYQQLLSQMLEPLDHSVWPALLSRTNKMTEKGHTSLKSSDMAGMFTPQLLSSSSSFPWASSGAEVQHKLFCPVHAIWLGLENSSGWDRKMQTGQVLLPPLCAGCLQASSGEETVKPL